MQGLERLGVIQELSRKDPKWKHTELFRVLRKEDIWISAYENIKANKGALRGMGITRLQRLQSKVLDESYKFSQIPKTSNDKIVQEVIRMVLESIYEPIFDNRRGVYDALQQVEKQLRSIDWVIEGHIKSAYPTIDHNRLCQIISQRIDDHRFMRLIRKSLKGRKFVNPNMAPIYTNIYFTELDEWVRQKYRKIEYCINYTRYADDWIIGIRGQRHIATEIKNEFESFLKFHLKQELHPDKTKITNIRAGKVCFLGYEIFLPRNIKIGKYKKKGSKQTMTLRFQMPVDKVIKRMKERGYITYDKNNKVRPISKSSYTQLEDVIIVNHFKSVWLGLHLQYIHYLLHISCAMTLAHRHRSSVKKILKKHGKRLEIIDKTGNLTKR
jgi:Type II intron maturase/Reverse transcriptase (RNA-dependent DNA polymerase)